jgi:hypothetical protein
MLHSLLRIGLIAVVLIASQTFAAEPTEALAEAVVAQAGGADKLLDIFRMREQIHVSKDPTPPPAADAPGNRTSIVDVGGDWWIGKKKRDQETAHVLCRAWSLRLLLEPASRLERLADVRFGDQAVVGLRVTGSVQQPLDLWFDAATNQLVAVDYLDSRHLFSDWRTTADGRPYPAHVTGRRFADAAAKTLRDQQWYQTDLLEVTPLSELPTELTP